MALPHGATGSLGPTFVSARAVALAVRPPYTLALLRAIAIRPEVTFARLRYLLGGDRPSQTAHQTLSCACAVRTLARQGWYPKGGSTEAGASASQPPTYPVHAAPRSNIRLQ